MSEVDNVLIAAAACELHPKALLKGMETRSVKDRLRAATDEAIELGLEGSPRWQWAAACSGGTTSSRRRRAAGCRPVGMRGGGAGGVG